jgi:hypothetical protein
MAIPAPTATIEVIGDTGLDDYESHHSKATDEHKLEDRWQSNVDAGFPSKLLVL